MPLRFQKLGLNFLPIAVLLVLLITLAFLQYRWIGQTTNGEHDKMREKARLAAENLSREFDRELTRAYFHLKVDPVSFSQKVWDNYSLRYERWLATAAYPKLVEKVFTAGKDASGNLRLSAYDETNGRFEETGWLPRLARVRSEIETDLNSATADSKKRRAPEIIAPDVPALVIPISTVNPGDLEKTRNDAPNESPNTNSSQRNGYTIVLLNLEYIKGELLPSLAARYFDLGANGAGDNYNVIVASRDSPPQILYRSGSSPEKTETPFGSEIRQDLFALRLERIESFIFVAPRRRKQLLKDDSATARSDSAAKIKIAPPSDTGDAANDLPSFGNQKSGWQLFAQYRGGSLEAAVESIRRRNLIISFGILLLVAANGIFLIVLLNRSRSLARRQSDFVSSVTHELRTPLAVIRATSENIADQIVTDAAQIKEYGIIINSEERRLTAMIEQLLEVAGTQNARKYGCDYRPETVAGIIEAALNDCQTELKARDAAVSLEIEPALPDIIADREALRRAIGNLIGNAVKYSRRSANGEGRQIKISARTAECKTSKQIEIAIRDNGIGIEKKDLPNIFKLFYRGKVAAENQIKGSGIGLSLVKQIVEAHGGDISVESRPNQGSTFTLRLPVTGKDSGAIR